MAASPPGSRRSTAARGGRAVGRALVPRRVRRRRADVLRRAAELRLDEIARSDLPVVAGPWRGGVGAELLYWIPLLAWLTAPGRVEPERLVAISRGGADGWYADVAANYVDLLDHFSVSTVGASDAHLPRRFTRGDRLEHSAFQLGCDAVGTTRVEWLHPAFLWRLFSSRWQWRGSGAVVWNRTLHRLLPAAPTGVDVELPDSYLALRVSFNSTFPDTSENRAFLDRMVTALSRRTSIVLLRAAEGLDGGSDYVPPGDAVHDVSGAITPRSNLALQTRIVRDARMLVSTYGGFSYLGAFVGTPTLALYSDAPADPVHLEAIDRVGRRLAADSTRLFRARHIGALRLAEAE